MKIKAYIPEKYWLDVQKHLIGNCGCKLGYDGYIPIEKIPYNFLYIRNKILSYNNDLEHYQKKLNEEWTAEELLKWDGKKPKYQPTRNNELLLGWDNGDTFFTVGFWDLNTKLILNVHNMGYKYDNYLPATQNNLKYLITKFKDQLED